MACETIKLTTSCHTKRLSLDFNAAVGKYGKYLYLFFNVVDDHLIFRGDNARSIFQNDHLELAFVTESWTIQSLYHR